MLSREQMGQGTGEGHWGVGGALGPCVCSLLAGFPLETLLTKITLHLIHHLAPVRLPLN